MKKLFIFTITSILALFSFHLPFRRVNAQMPQEYEYACILQENTFFYASPDEKRGLFLLPVTYYVKLLEYGEAFCRVEYLYDDEKVQKLVGYAKTETLTFVEYTPQTPYFSCFFDVCYRIEGEGLDDSSFLNEIRLTCAYYGDYTIGSKTYCYVLREGALGYVPKPASLHVPRNTEYENWLISQTPSSSEAPIQSKEKESSSPAQIAILVALCLLVPILAALILKPPRRPPYETDG